MSQASAKGSQVVSLLKILNKNYMVWDLNIKNVTICRKLCV